jgi:thioredoxin 1
MKLFHFTAEWCNPCKKIKPIINEYVIENPHIIYEAINVDENPEIAKEYGVLSIPTLIAIDDNADVIGRHTGVATKEQIRQLFK